MIELQGLKLDIVADELWLFLANPTEPMFLSMIARLIDIKFVGPTICTDSSLTSLAEVLMKKDAEFIVA